MKKEYSEHPQVKEAISEIVEHFKGVSVTTALKQVTNKSYTGLLLHLGGKGFIANATGGYQALISWENEYDFSNGFGQYHRSQKEVIESYQGGIKRVFIFNTAQELFKWLSE